MQRKAGGKGPIAGKIEVTRKTIRIERVIGEETKQVTVSTTVDFPAPVRKIKDVTAEVIDLTSEIIGGRKIVVQGVLHKQIGWVPEGEGEEVVGDDDVIYEVGGVYDFPFNESFTSYVEFEGLTPGSEIILDARVEYVDHNRISVDKWQQTVIIELFVKATEVVDLEVITDVTAPGMDIDVCKETFTVAAVIGTAEDQVNLRQDIEFPRDRDVAKVKEATARVKNVTTEVLPGKVLVKGTLHKQIFYVEAGSRRLFETSVDENFTTQVAIPGVQPGMEADVTANVRIEYMDLDLMPGQGDEPDRVRQTAILQVMVRAVRDMKVEIVIAVKGAGIHVETEKVIVETVVGRGQKQEIVRNTQVTFPRPVRKIADIDARVDINRQETTVLPNKVIVEGLLHKQIYHVGLCDDAVWEQGFDEPFTTYIDIKGAEPGMSINVRGKVETVDMFDPVYPPNICPIFLGEVEGEVFTPADFPWQQNAIVQVMARVTKSEEVEVVTDVTLGAAKPPTPEKPEEEEECPDNDNGDNNQPSMRYYTIRPGDTLWKIAKRYGTTVEALMQLNPGIDPQNLQVGQKIRIS